MNGRALVALNLRRLRIERGISQERLAADAAVDRAYVSELERQLGNASVDMLDKLATVLGVDLGQFFIKPSPNDPEIVSLPVGRKARGAGQDR